MKKPAWQAAPLNVEPRKNHRNSDLSNHLIGGDVFTRKSWICVRSEGLYLRCIIRSNKAGKISGMNSELSKRDTRKVSNSSSFASGKKLTVEWSGSEDFKYEISLTSRVTSEQPEGDIVAVATLCFGLISICSLSVP